MPTFAQKPTKKSGFKQGKVSRPASRSKSVESKKLQDMLAIAQERGLLAGTRTHIVRGRMPAGLVAEAKLNSGITSDSKLLEAALANLAVADGYWEWLTTQRGTISRDIDLEF